MSKRAIILLSCVMALALCQAFGGTIIDRIVATVNGHIILQSDWQDEVCYDAFMDGHPLGQITAQERKAALDRLIDQELLREQVNPSDALQPNDAEVEKRLQEIRKQYDPSGKSVTWQEALKEYGLTESEVKSRISEQINLMRLVDARLLPNVQVDEKSIESYYNQELLPQLRQSGAPGTPPLATVTPKIKELLTQKKVSELLVAWLHNLRAESQIQNSPNSGANHP